MANLSLHKYSLHCCESHKFIDTSHIHVVIHSIDSTCVQCKMSRDFNGAGSGCSWKSSDFVKKTAS